MKRWIALPLIACAWTSALAQPPEDDRGPPTGAPPPAPVVTPPPPPPGPSLQVCRTKVLTPPEKAYCCSTYHQMRRACM